MYLAYIDCHEASCWTSADMYRLFVNAEDGHFTELQENNKLSNTSVNISFQFRVYNKRYVRWYPFFEVYGDLHAVLYLNQFQWEESFLEKLIGPDAVKKFPVFCGTHRFITAFTTSRHWPVSWARSCQFTPSPPPLSSVPLSFVLLLPSDL
jgi:hypothetical protein